MEDKELPVYQAGVDDNDPMTGVVAVGLVDDPAIQRSWVAYSNGRTGPAPTQLAVNPDEEQMLTGPLLIPGQKIYRSDEDGEYYIQHSRESVAATAQKYFSTGQAGTTTTNHQKRNMPGIRVVESWLIKDPQKDKSSALGLRNLPSGTWMVSVKVDDVNYWNRNIKGKKLTGFSLEGYFTHKPVHQTMKPENEVLATVQGMTTEQRQSLAAALKAAEKPEKPSLAQQLLRAFGLQQEDKDKKEDEKLEMEVLLPDGTGLTIPDSGEMEVTDADGNAVGKLRFIPADAEAAEAPQDTDAPVENPEDVALQSQVTQLSEQVAELKGALEAVASATPSAKVRQNAVKPAGAEPATPKKGTDTMPGQAQPAEAFSVQQYLKNRKSANDKTPAKTA